METVDKVKARNDALADLGLAPEANAKEIRDAWRKIAFRDHPDHQDSGDVADFARAKTAFDYLRSEGLTAKGGINDGVLTPRRPRLKKRIIDLPKEEIAACRSLLSPDRRIEHHAATENDAVGHEIASSDHVPDAIGCFGRHLTYFVATPVCEGPNRVALPVSVLVSSRHANTEILSFQSKNHGGGEVVVPDTILEQKFPGAKSVRIRFAANQDVREEFWLAG